MKDNSPDALDLSAPFQGKVEAFDPDEQAHNLKDWDQRYDQMSRGNFYGRIDEVQLNNVHIFKEFTNQSVHQQCNVWPNGIWLGFSANQKSYRFNGEIIGADSATVQPGNREFELLTPEMFFIHGIVIEQSALDKMAQIQGLELKNFLSSPIIKLKKERLKGLNYILGEFVNTPQELKPGTLQQELLIMNVLDTLELDGLDTPQALPSFQRRKAVVEKVKTYILERPEKAITITELCEIAHVSRRSLQYSFETVMGMSPLKYLKITRLNDVRRDILKNTDPETTITSIASQRGFWHAGQFTRDYTLLFGENPSETMRKTLT